MIITIILLWNNLHSNYKRNNRLCESQLYEGYSEKYKDYIECYRFESQIDGSYIRTTKIFLTDKIIKEN